MIVIRFLRDFASANQVRRGAMNTRELTIITAAVVIAGSVAISALASESENWSHFNSEVQSMGLPVFGDRAGVNIVDIAQLQEALASKK